MLPGSAEPAGLETGPSQRSKYKHVQHLKRHHHVCAHMSVCKLCTGSQGWIGGGSGVLTRHPLLTPRQRVQELFHTHLLATRHRHIGAVGGGGGGVHLQPAHRLEAGTCRRIRYLLAAPWARRQRQRKVAVQAARMPASGGTQCWR